MRRQLVGGVSQYVQASGNYFYITGASGTADIVAKVNGRKFTLLAGRGFRLRNGELFSEVELYTETTQEIYIEISSDEFIDGRISGDVDSTIVCGSSASDDTRLTRASAGQVTVPANASRKALILTASPSNGSTIVYTGSTALKGIPLEAGDGITYEGAANFTGALVCYMSGAGDLFYQDIV